MSKFADIAPRIWSGLATDDELRGLKVDDIVAIKSDAEHVRLRMCTRAKPKSVDREAGSVEWVASDETTDRMGDVIRVKGWDTKAWMRNPMILRNHNSNELPLGLGDYAKKDRLGDDPVLLIGATFFPIEKLDEEGQLYRTLVLDGDLPASSVGFIPRKVTRPSDSDEREKIGLGEWGVLYEATELLEHSVVTVPANPSALLRKLDSMVDAGSVAKTLVAQFAERLAPSTRTVVALGSLAECSTRTTNDSPDVGVVSPTTAPTVEDRIEALRADLRAFKDTLTLELSAFRAAFEQTTRAADAEANRSVPSQAPAQAAVESPSVANEDYGAALLDTARPILRSPKEG